MIISVTRSGGFAGISENLGAIDTKQLPPEKIDEIENLLSSLDFSSLPAKVSGGPIGFDLIEFEITIKNNEDRLYSVKFIDDGSPETALLHQLVTSLYPGN